MSFIDDEYDTIRAIMANAVGPIAASYHAFVEEDDLKQDCWEWCWRRQDKVEEYLKREDEGQRKGGERALFVTLRRLAVRIAKKAKAEQSGYQVTDEYYYSTEQIKDLLSYYFAGDWSAKMQVDDSDVRYTRTLDPAEGNNVLATMSDIDYAWRCLTSRDQQILVLLYDEPAHTLTDIAAMFNITPTTVQRREQRSLDKIQRALGGESPWH